MLHSAAGLPVPGSVLGLRVTAVQASGEAPVVRVWGRAGERAEEEHRRLRAEIRGAVAAEEQVCTPAVGQYCLVQEEEAGDWLRCKVTQRLGPEYRVYLLDQGGQATARPNTLRPAAGSLFQLPPQALGCVLANLVPLEKKGWSTQALRHLHSLLGQEVKGLVKDLLLPQGIVILDLAAVSKYLLDSGLAKFLPDPLFRLLVDSSLAEVGCSAHWPEKVETHQPLTNNMSIVKQLVPLQSTAMDFFYPQFQSGVTEPVVVTQVSDPQRVFCQLRSLSHEVQRLSEGMHNFYESQNACGDAKFQQPFALGQPCASRGTDGHWYRSLLQEIIPGKQLATVIHVDWGRRDVVPLTNLRNLAADFFRMPVVTFRCALYGVPDDWDLPLLFELRSFLYEKHVIAKIEFYNSYEHLYVITLFAENGLNINCLYGMRAQNLKACPVKAPITTESTPCAKEDVKIDTPKVLQSFYVPMLATVELKMGAFYDAMVDFVIDPSNFWIRTEEHSANHNNMVNCITKMYSQASKLDGIVVKPVPGQLCCAKFRDDIYYRAEIVSVEKKKVKLYFLDHGNLDIVDLYDVKELPAEFRDLPALANRCCVADIHPLGETWSHESILAFKIAVFDKKLVICVVSKEAEQYTIEVLDQSRIQERSVGKILWNAGYVNYEELEPAVQLSNVVKAMRVEVGQTALSQATLNQVSSKASQQEIIASVPSEENTEELHYSPFEEQLFEPGARIEVVISYVENPGLFWCQNSAYLSELTALMKVLQDHCSPEKYPYKGGDFACLAQCPDNGIWYRAFITEIPTSISKTDTVEVLYVDYGNKDHVPVANLCAIKSEFFQLKAQAFKCSVYNIVTPTGSNPFYWDVNATKVFQEFVREAFKWSEFHCTVFAVASLDKTLFNIVDLFTPFSSVGDALVKRGFATRQLHKSLAPSVQLHSYYYSMHGIKTGSEEEIFITHVNPSLEFYCQLSRTTETIEKISSAVTKVCNKTRRLKLPHDSGPLCLAKFIDQQWYRGFILSDRKASVEIFFVDFGNVEMVSKEDILPITCSEHELIVLPMQAIKCSLPDIPSNVPGEIVSWFEKTVLCKAIRALVVAKDADGKLLVELYDGSQQINATVKSKLGLRVPKIASNCLPSAPENNPKQTEARKPLTNVDSKERRNIRQAPLHRESNNTINSDAGQAVHKKDTGYPRYQVPAEREVENKPYSAARFQDFSTQKPFNNVDTRERKSTRQDLLPRDSNNDIHSEKPSIAYPKKVPAANAVENKDYSAARSQEFNSHNKESMTFRRAPPSGHYQEKTVGRDTMPIVKKSSADRPATLAPSSGSFQDKPVGQDTMPIVNKSTADRSSSFAEKRSASSKCPLMKYSDMPRRQIFPGMQMPVYISHINTVFDFYVQFAEGGQLDEISAMLNDDRSTFETLADKEITMGDVVCAYFADDELYYRAVVTGKSMQGLKVQYIDYGNTATISNCKTYRLTVKLCSIPIMSVRCSLSRLDCAEPTPNMNDILDDFSKRTSDFQLDCKFVKQYELNWDVMLNDQHGCINDLLALHGGHSLAEHIEEEGDEITTEEKLEEKYAPCIKSFTWSLPLPGETANVYASAVDSPEYFWCQLSTADIDSLAIRVQEAGEQAIKNEDFNSTLEIGSPCNVMYSEDDNWYRATVTKIAADLVTVRFIDYGNEDTVNVDQIRQLSDTLLKNPAQAFPCCLAGFNCKAGTWSSEGRNYFYEKVSEDLLEVTVREIQDEPHLIPLAFVSVKYNDINFNEEMRRFWKTEQDTVTELLSETSHEDFIKESLAENQPPTEGLPGSPTTSLQMSKDNLRCEMVCTLSGDDGTETFTNGVKEAADLLHTIHLDVATAGSARVIEEDGDLRDNKDFDSNGQNDRDNKTVNINAEATREQDITGEPDYAEMPDPQQITSSHRQETRENSESMESLILQFSEKLILLNEEAITEDTTKQDLTTEPNILAAETMVTPAVETLEEPIANLPDYCLQVGKDEDSSLACEDFLETEDCKVTEKFVERETTVAAESFLESEESVVDEDTMESKQFAADEFTLDITGTIACKKSLEKEEALADVDSLESKEASASKNPLESNEAVVEEGTQESHEAVAGEDTLGYEAAIFGKSTLQREEAVADESTIESKEAVAGQGAQESSEAVVGEDSLEYKETVTDEDILEYKKAVADEASLGYKEAVAGKTSLEYKSAVAEEASLEYKEAVADDDILEYKEAVAVDDILEYKVAVADEASLEYKEAEAGKTSLEYKSAVAEETSLEYKEAVADDDILEYKEAVAVDDILEYKEAEAEEASLGYKEAEAEEASLEYKAAEAEEASLEYKEAVANEAGLEYKKPVADKDILEYKEAVADDDILEYKEAVADDDILEYKEAVADEDIMEYKEAVAAEDILVYKEVVADNMLEYKEAVADDDILEYKEAVADYAIVEYKEAVAEEDILVYKEVVADNILEYKEAVADDDILEYKEAVADEASLEYKEAVVDEDILEFKVDVAGKDIQAFEEDVAGIRTLKSKEVPGEGITESEEAVAGKGTLESEEAVADTFTIKSEEAVSVESTHECKEAEAIDATIESEDTVAGEDIVESKEAEAGKGIMKSEDAVPGEDIVECKEADAGKGTLESEEAVAAACTIKSKEAVSVESTHEGKQAEAIDATIESEDTVAGEDIVESKEAEAGKGIMECEDAVGGEGNLEYKEAVAGEGPMESVETVQRIDKEVNFEMEEAVASLDLIQHEKAVADEEIWENEAAVSIGRIMESKSAVANKDFVETEEVRNRIVESGEAAIRDEFLAITRENVAESEDFVADKVEEASENVVIEESVVSGDDLKFKERSVIIGTMQIKEAGANGNYVEIKDANEHVMESKEAVVNEDAGESKEAVANGGAEESKEAVANGGAEESKEAVANGGAEETKKAVANEDAGESKEAVANESTEESKEAVSNKGAKESKEAVVNEGTKESKEAVANEDAAESKEAVANEGTEESKEAVANEGAEESKEAVANEGIEESKEAVANEGAMESISKLLDVQQASEQEHEVREDQLQEVCRGRHRKTSDSHDVEVTASDMPDYAEHPLHSTEEQQTLCHSETIDLDRLENKENFLLYRVSPPIIASMDSVYESDVSELAAEADSADSEAPWDISEERWRSEYSEPNAAELGDVSTQDLPECDDSNVTITEDTCETDTDECNPETAALGDPGNKVPHCLSDLPKDSPVPALSPLPVAIDEDCPGEMGTSPVP